MGTRASDRRVEEKDGGSGKTNSSPRTIMTKRYVAVQTLSRSSCGLARSYPRQGWIFPLGIQSNPETLALVKEKFKINMTKGGFEDNITEKAMHMVEQDDIPIHEFIDLFVKDVTIKI